MKSLLTFNLLSVGKEFSNHWVLKNINCTLQSGQSCAIIGNNGSGKSTLLQIIIGNLSSSTGTIDRKLNNIPIDLQKLYKHICVVAPYLQLIEDLTAIEFLRFHATFRPWYEGINEYSILQKTGLDRVAHIPIKKYSSGMKQRLKIAQAVFSQSLALFLDEPCSHLDSAGVIWYQNLINDCRQDKLIVVCSNNPIEYDFCEKYIRL
ncbi:MAG: ABC transporter ATP-binding protein [Phycisphaerales bacterium]|nr:ABC transporter ATP-binding protein [Phycisphaerales bacterium]